MICGAWCKIVLFCDSPRVSSQKKFHKIALIFAYDSSKNCTKFWCFCALMHKSYFAQILEKSMLFRYFELFRYFVKFLETIPGNDEWKFKIKLIRVTGRARQLYSTCWPNGPQLSGHRKWKLFFTENTPYCFNIKTFQFKIRWWWWTKPL